MDLTSDQEGFVLLTLCSWRKQIIYGVNYGIESNRVGISNNSRLYFEKNELSDSLLKFCPSLVHVRVPTSL